MVGGRTQKSNIYFLGYPTEICYNFYPLGSPPKVFPWLFMGGALENVT